MQPMQVHERKANATSWKPGGAPQSSRPPGVVNKNTRTMKNAAVAAAEELGRLHTDEWAEHVKLPDPDGMKHYFKVLAVHEKRVFAMFLARIMPLSVETNTTQQLITHQEMLERLKASGLPLELINHIRFVDADDLDPEYRQCAQVHLPCPVVGAPSNIAVKAYIVASVAGRAGSEVRVTSAG
jgi:hypothetical protein